MTQNSFLDEQFLMFFDNNFAMIIETNETRSSNVEKVCDAINKQNIENTSKTSFSSTESFNSFDFSVVNDQNMINFCFISSFRSFELCLCIDQFRNNDKRKSISKTTSNVINDFKCESNEHHNIDCVSNDQMSYKSILFENFVFFHVIELYMSKCSLI